MDPAQEPERLEQRGHHVRFAAIHEVRHQSIALERTHLEDLPGDTLYLGIAEFGTLRGCGLRTRGDWRERQKHGRADGADPEQARVCRHGFNICRVLPMS